MVKNIFHDKIGLIFESDFLSNFHIPNPSDSRGLNIILAGSTK